MSTFIEDKRPLCEDSIDTVRKGLESLIACAKRTTSETVIVYATGPSKIRVYVTRNSEVKAELAHYREMRARLELPQLT